MITQDYLDGFNDATLFILDRIKKRTKEKEDKVVFVKCHNCKNRYLFDIDLNAIAKSIIADEEILGEHKNE